MHQLAGFLQILHSGCVIVYSGNKVGRGVGETKRAKEREQGVGVEGDQMGKKKVRVERTQHRKNISDET